MQWLMFYGHERCPITAQTFRHSQGQIGGSIFRYFSGGIGLSISHVTQVLISARFLCLRLVCYLKKKEAA